MICCRRRAAYGNDHAGICLSDILHEVLLLLGLIPSESLAPLTAVSRKCRREVHEHFRYIAVLHQGHIHTLARGTWPRLLVWHVGYLKRYSCVWRYTLPSTSDAVITLLAKGHWPKLQELQLDRGSISAAGIARLHHAFALCSCSLYSAGLSSATV